MAERVVSGFVLPEEWSSTIDSPRWTTYRQGDRADPAVVEATFGEIPERSWRFYTFGEIAGMTEEWRLERDPAWLGSEPDSIDPLRSVLIGELDYDRPIALDYRPRVPAVRFMRTDGRWPVVASSLRQLLEKLNVGIWRESRHAAPRSD
jgi:hypothetical protein